MMLMPTWWEWLKFFLCGLIGHRAERGVSKARSIQYRCTRCGSLVPGGMGPRR